MKIKKFLKFVPLAIGISSLILYIWNVINYKSVNDPDIELQLAMRMRLFIYISIAGFIIYFLIRLIDELRVKNSIESKYEYSEPKVIEKIVEVEKPEIIEKEVVKTEIKEVILEGNKYCSNCGERIFDIDRYCKSCGSYQLETKTGRSKLIRVIIYVIKLLILLIILLLLIKVLINYKKTQTGVVSNPFSIVNKN